MFVMKSLVEKEIFAHKVTELLDSWKPVALSKWNNFCFYFKLTSINHIWDGGGGGVIFVPPILTFVLDQQWCSNLVSSFTNRGRVHKIIQNYESTQASRLMTS